MKPVQGLTLCGKRINQYCDQDRDKRVSIAEWTMCLDVASGTIVFIFFYLLIIVTVQLSCPRSMIYFSKLHDVIFQIPTLKPSF